MKDDDLATLFYSQPTHLGDYVGYSKAGPDVSVVRQIEKA